MPRFRRRRPRPEPTATTPLPQRVPTPPTVPVPPVEVLGLASPFACDVVPGDSLVVQRQGVPRTPDVLVMVTAVSEEGETVAIALRPSRARMVAAALLNAADEATGTVALNFVPASPDGEEPVRA